MTIATVQGMFDPFLLPLKMVNFTLDKTSFLVLTIILILLIIMSWTRVWSMNRDCKVSMGIINPRCSSKVIRYLWTFFAIVITLGGVGLIIWSYRQTQVVISKDPCEISFDNEDCDIATFCYDPPDVYAAQCRQYCDRRLPELDQRYPECLLYHCETAISRADKFWETDVHNELIETCYDTCYQRVIDGFDTVCSQLICSQPVSEIGPPYSLSEIDTQCDLYCEPRPYSETCYQRTCGVDDADISDKCLCNAYIAECTMSLTEPSCEVYREACLRHCADNSNDSICDEFDCIENPVPGCNQICVGDDCLPTGESASFVNKCSKRYAVGDTGLVDLCDDCGEPTEYGYTFVGDGQYVIHATTEATRQMHVDSLTSYVYFEDTSEQGELFYFVSTGKQYEYYIRTVRQFDSGNGSLAHRYLGEMTRTSGESCTIVMGIVPTPSKTSMNRIKWRFTTL